MMVTYYDGIIEHMHQLQNESNQTTGLLDMSRYGDWCSLQVNTGCRKASALVSTFYYIIQMDAIAQAASVLEIPDDEKMFTVYGSIARNAFQKAFYDSANKMYVAENLEAQTSIPLALTLGVVPKEDVEAVVANLVDDIVSKHQYHMNTGKKVTAVECTLLLAGTSIHVFCMAQGSTPDKI